MCVFLYVCVCCMYAKLYYGTHTLWYALLLNSVLYFRCFICGLLFCHKLFDAHTTFYHMYQWLLLHKNHLGDCFKNIGFRVPGWLTWLRVWLLVSAQVMISWFVSLSPTSRSELTERSLIRTFSPSVSDSSRLALSLSQKIN